MATSLFNFPPHPEVTGLAIGVFDGVHLGHRAILKPILNIENGASAVLTFDPHPLAVLAPEKAPPRLTTPAQRATLLHAGGIDEVLTVQFDEALREVSATGFLDELHRIFPALRRVSTGPNWCFGKGRSGNAAALNAYGAAHRFSGEEVEPVFYEGTLISSTRIREALKAHDFIGAAAMLGREYEVEGTVIRGDGRGAQLGFPTANVGHVGQLLPPPGVYGCQAIVAGQLYSAVANYGLKPTFGAKNELTLEVHLLDFTGQVYDAPIKVGRFRFLRGEQKFPSLDALKAQIAKDIAAAAQV